MTTEPTHVNISVSDSPAPEELAALKQRVVDFNNDQHPFEASRPVACFVRDDNGELVAGASGSTWWGWLTVEYLWVADSQRGSGLGGKVLRAIEDEARRRGCHGVWLDTFSFQARPFYERRGYSQFGELVDFPPGSTRHFMWKRL